jgi:BirA family transcriptional regulator, biotin operon repressor / biotin---[acetyl-CoA-carboxylase] ligase
VTGEGDIVRPAEIEPRLGEVIPGPVIWMTETGSTNAVCVARARAGAAHGLVVGADHQTEGRGRRGRAWEDRPGDALMVSVLLRPPLEPDRVGLLPIVAAVAVADALAAAVEVPVEIAWPNDVIVGGRKMAGILCEVSVAQTGVAWAVVGMGINVASVPAVRDARWSPGCLADVGSSMPRPELLVWLLHALEGRYTDWLAAGPAAILAAFAERDYLRGRRVSLSRATGTLEGRVVGLDATGQLIVEDAEGEIHHLGAAEVTRVLSKPL